MTHQAQLDLYELHTGRRQGGGGRGGRRAVARGGRPRGAGGGVGGSAAAASQELSTSGKSPGASRAETKYPVRGNPSFRYEINELG